MRVKNPITFAIIPGHHEGAVTKGEVYQCHNSLGAPEHRGTVKEKTPGFLGFYPPEYRVAGRPGFSALLGALHAGSKTDFFPFFLPSEIESPIFTSRYRGTSCVRSQGKCGESSAICGSSAA